MSRSCLGGERAIVCIMVARLLFHKEMLSGEHTNIHECIYISGSPHIAHYGGNVTKCVT